MVDLTIFGQKETKGEGRRWRAVGATEGRRKVLPSFLPPPPPPPPPPECKEAGRKEKTG